MARKKKSSVFIPLGDPTTLSPGINSRMEVATGFLWSGNLFRQY